MAAFLQQTAHPVGIVKQQLPFVWLQRIRDHRYEMVDSVYKQMIQQKFIEFCIGEIPVYGIYFAETVSVFIGIDMCL